MWIRWIVLCLPLLVGTVLALTAPGAGRRLPPRTAAWMLTLAAVIAAGAWVTALAMIGFTFVGQNPEVAEEGRWSPHVLAADNPVDWPVAAGCALAALVCAAALVVASWRRVRVMVEAWRECRDLPVAGDLTVLDDPAPAAFALPGVPGRVVVSSGMLKALTADERRALLAHERAHLHHRHHLFLLALQLAAAVNPLLRPLAKAGAFALERWADEEASAAVADRPLVARAVARAALAAKRAPAAAMAATGGPVPQRVKALLAPPTPLRRGLAVALTALIVVCCASLALTAHDVQRLFVEAAMPSRHHEHR
ncbi:M48 family metalloprotease [Streptomyces sp. YGL11-2]|uniref:M48 family metalloprotease n=1 Tax=Streptomyces sp. YGL11-2 TaxID=3414028 RepID=UPI003CF535A7